MRLKMAKLDIPLTNLLIQVKVSTDLPAIPLKDLHLKYNMIDLKGLPLELIVENRLIARGELVQWKKDYCFKINQLIK